MSFGYLAYHPRRLLEAGECNVPKRGSITGVGCGGMVGGLNGDGGTRLGTLQGNDCGGGTIPPLLTDVIHDPGGGGVHPVQGGARDDQLMLL